MRGTSWLRVLVAALLLLAAAPTTAGAASTRPAPVVLFPAFHLTKLTVNVSGQTAAPGCPAPAASRTGTSTTVRAPFSARSARTGC